MPVHLLCSDCGVARVICAPVLRKKGIYPVARLNGGCCLVLSLCLAKRGRPANRRRPASHGQRWPTSLIAMPARGLTSLSLGKASPQPDADPLARLGMLRSYTGKEKSHVSQRKR